MSAPEEPPKPASSPMADAVQAFTAGEGERKSERIQAAEERPGAPSPSPSPTPSPAPEKPAFVWPKSEKAAEKAPESKPPEDKPADESKADEAKPAEAKPAESDAKPEVRG